MKELEEAPKPIIGFHIRWGDKLDEDILLVSYLPAIMATPPRAASKEGDICKGRAARKKGKALVRVKWRLI